MVQSPHRPPRRSIQANFNNPEMFSPTSTAALALSTLHKFGADQANSASSNNEARTSSVSTLKGTRLFNGAPSNRPESTAIGSSDYETKGNEPPSLSDVLVPTMNHEEGTEAAKMPPSSSNFYTSEQTLPGNGHHHSCVSSQMWHPPPASHQTQSPPAPPYHQSVPPLHIASTGRAVYQHHESYHPPHYHCCHSYAEHHHPRPYYHQDHHHPPHQPWSSQQPAPPIVSSNAPHHGAPRVYTPHHGMQSSVPSGVGYANHGMVSNQYVRLCDVHSIGHYLANLKPLDWIFGHYRQRCHFSVAFRQVSHVHVLFVLNIRSIIHILRRLLLHRHRPSQRISSSQKSTWLA